MATDINPPGRHSRSKSFLLLFLEKEDLPFSALPTLIVTADDFGLTPSINQAVTQAHTSGILTTASLMVSAPAAADAVLRARAAPDLAVGLHLVVIDGTPTLPPALVPDLVGTDGRFPTAQLRLGVNYFFRPHIRRQLAAEIRAQFEAFHATGLVLDHANAHKHMHLHPTVGRLMLEIGRDYGLRAIRLPREAPFPGGPPQDAGAAALRRWCTVLERQAARAGVLCNHTVVGLGWTGHMTLHRVQAALGQLGPGLTEMYFHPASRHDATLEALMPGYEHEAELHALLHARLPDGVVAGRFGDVVQGR